MLTFILVFSLAGLLGSSAQIIQDGQCNPDIALFANFNIDNFLGDWYEVARTDNTRQSGDCSTVNIAAADDGVISIRNEVINRNFYEETTGTLSQEGETSRLTLNLNGFSEPVDFWVLNTNYVNFALTYKCVNINPTQRAIYVWQLGRQQSFSELFEALMNTTLFNLLGITLADLRNTDFSEDACYELPVIEENTPIVLPGLCDANIPVVETLDVERFTGVWHEISSYYSENALGTCARAEYTLEDGVVNVLNSQVVNQALDTISGNATTADGSGRLFVTLEVSPGVLAEQELWVLDTDYDDYAVLYSCVNQPNDQKRVYSWITSRTRQQSTAAQAAVTALVDSIIDLNAVYYETTDQSDDGCFYFPDVVPDKPVVFRGLCDMSIPAMANFDAVRYMGLWHEIESYPSIFQTGTCNNAYYTLDLTTAVVDVFNTQVIDQRLDTINGSAVIADDAAGTGKLVVTFPIADTDLTTSTDYWVLDTDYENYALVYTCYNIDLDTRGVFSWKLSRSKELSSEANTAIDAVISTIPVLDARYYQRRDQSVDGCFYFPEPQLGVPVVFPGQCDDSLAAVPGFSLSDFEGVWHEIQSYPKIEQSGECINHAFSQTGNTLDLQSSQIVDQFLSVTAGNVAFTSTDGSARLAITIVVDNQVIEIPYWILRTDYTDYALAYSCVNINSDFRGIWSWKLSRTRQLSPSANTAIDEATSSIVVLDNVYYEPVDQSDPACFYLPELEPGEPIILPGQCQADIPVVQNFDTEKYLGRWRLIESYPSEFQNGTCNDATYSLGDNEVLVYNTQVINERLDTIDGSAVPATANNDGKLLVTFPNAEPLEYWILDTDYESYALVYSCVNIDADWRRVWSWKMSRTRQLSDIAITNINNVINGIDVLNNRYFEEVDNSDAGCFYYPIPDGKAVEFRGQCDENVRVVTNFDVERYMGTWYDIESYPQEFQNGTCSTATYTLTDNGVEVYNTQVINERLDDIYGLAVPDNDEGLAKLIVTFPIAGTEFTINSPYWVLDTDYNNYAVVYACVNLNEDLRRVTSWKLSRQRTLSAASETAVNNVINEVQVLSQEYFSNRDHTDEGCFYYPEPEAGRPVVFPGQCDDSIQAQSNFDLNRFSGLWHEIAAYPKIEQEGQCVDYDFTVSTTDSFSLYTSQVIGLSLDETNATVVRTSTDNSGRFTITLYANGETITIPYWIISTDYDNYALAYSCVNDGPNFRGVWSWKLSRAKQLSTSSEAAIDQAMAPIDVLGNQYFETTSQSDESCFYLPDLGPDDFVIFRGQCDQSIPVVQNFDPARYGGRWRLIQSYRSDFQSGTCNDATYTLQDDNTVLVLNTQVINERLDTITGSAVLATTDGTGKLLVNFPGADEPTEYWILDTDYESYSLVYTCVNLNSDQRRVWSWKMSRTTTLSDNANTAIDQIVNGINVLDDQYYQSIDQSDTGCFYFPIPDGSTVFFRGQCDESVQVVTGFDVERYMGLWYDIESYPQDFQNGTCSTATYTLTSDGVEVYNTQVVDETLDYIYGSAVPEFEDGQAKLIVTFPVAGTDFTITSPYWVLTTDYNNYALVYSCVNIHEDLRRVTSWKLSRERTLAPASVTAINDAINNVQVLSQDYYEYRDHTDEGCFYYPEPVAGQPVVFPGQCDDTIQAVPNFDLNRFSGLWYETAAYPKDQQEGQCVDYDFTVSTTDSFSLYTSQVIGLSLDETNATVVRTSTDNSGRFTITLYANGETITIPYWIISTDYDNYALAYSCVNDGPNFRGVWSWKLSRAKQLSTSSEAAIDQAMAPIDVLGNQYFETTSQSDESCFYLPDLGPDDSVIFRGQCDQSIPVVQNFDPARYGGRWRLIQSYQSDFQSGTCNDATYTLQDDNTVLVLNTQVINERLDTITGSAVLATTDGTGKLLVNFPGADEPTEYWILDTDYESYSLVYTCVNLNSDQRRVWSWKMSRTATLSDNANTAIDQIVNGINVLDDQYYQSIDQSDTGCFYFPIPDGSTVFFRGQCDESVQVVTGFDVERYMGLWYDIESYPQDFQNGTCSTATYTLTSDGVEVYNTQVVDETLDYIYGSAVPEFEDGQAKLIVTFPVAGTDFTITSPYWVLTTDYNNYALVYSCVNIHEDLRRVTSWKLSRERTLAPASVTAINDAINNVQVLSQEYYEYRDHTDEGCFYYPEPVAGQPVVFPGQCDDTIQAVPNFDLNRFSGLWHETAAYPKDQQDGQCVNYDFEATSDNTLDLYTTQVIDQLLDKTNATAQQTSNDNSARFLITINVDGTVIEIPYWIVATDYDNYAVAYSCVNQGPNYRGVWSWKLSRTKQMSAESEIAINDAIADIPVLGNQYYEETIQTDESCFFLPVLEPTDPVVFVGQCDPNIAVIQDFDPTRYEGRWRLIESYASEFQAGTCNDATYTIQSDGTVLVYNTQVIDESLDTITGSAILATTDGSGKLLVTFPEAPEPVEYWILDTDYENYALVYSCVNLNSEQRQVWSWKLSRTTSLSDDAKTNIDRIVDTINVLDDQYYSEIDHSDTGCFYFPVPDGNPVVFRGQCDDSISVVENFDIPRYMGTWYDIETYPQAFQDGTCATATYTLTDDGVLVYNTQIIDQLLDNVNATAVPASDDGSAKLIVTFPIAGTDLFESTPYWVLDTDYVNYALVYSCTNIDEEYRSVTSWKLSRDQELSAASQTAINNAINNVQVLDNQYYVERGHSEEDCFYYPDNFGGPVFLNGQCEDQNAVADFNINLFSGTWHEAARFPSNEQTGECAANELVFEQNTLILTQTIVYNERLTTVSGPATISDDGRGIITATLSNDEGVSIERTLYVLDTDYTEFAVLFSCVEVDEESKQVYSWKLSRSRSPLSASANERIDEVVTENVDLYEGYYEYTDQTNDGCFYYPVFEEPEAIVLPGPCDDRIQAKANFNAGAYLGRWFEIEKYPQRDQEGECSRAHYSEGQGEAPVDVLNTIVNNRTLRTQEGTAEIVSTDGSGILRVTFILDDDVVAENNYYVLETDYTSFALVYSCRDLENGDSEVYSWKLGRQPTLSVEANNIINEVISNTRGLLGEYYESTSQSDEDCFYVPAVNNDAAVLFRGQCEALTGKADFDMTRYVGWWHEIERYPTGNDEGECISSQYSSAGSGFQVIDTNVFGETGQVTTGTVVASNNGMLTRTLSNGQTEVLWVLDTDYETYSILYSCVNTDDGEYRRVWSAKHSKQRSLSTEAQDAMALVIDDNEVLYQNFYIPVLQTNAACFHYPPPTGETVILPGQCDDNIPTVASFNPASYTGTWYQIERYPYPEISSSATCIGARYRYNAETGVMTILNWEMVDGTLNTIEGTAEVDGAKLVVSMPNEGSNETTTTELYILHSDYVTYSVAYTCANINQFQRAVVAFKLSRTRDLPASAVTSINNYMATREELDQIYFIDVEHENCMDPSSATLLRNSFIVILVCLALRLFV